MISVSRHIRKRILVSAPAIVLFALAIAFLLGGWIAAIVLLVVMVVVFGCLYDGWSLA